MSTSGIAPLPVAQLFVRLCEIPSPSRHEGAVAGAVLSELSALGAEVVQDDAAARIGAGCNNILARFPATVDGGVPVAFAAHLDTVPNRAPIEVEQVDGMLTNRHEAILGGDDKSAVAAMLEAVRQIKDRGLPHAGIELLFTPCEEIGLKGAAAFDPSVLHARAGFVYDHPGPIGDIITRAPSLRKITATFVGTPAHAGIVPEDGRSAVEAAAAAIGRMTLRRVDAETTANVGVVEGGSATNVVAERCTLQAEARSLTDARLAAQVTSMLDALTWAASEHEVDVEVAVDREFDAYLLKETDTQVVLASRALEAIGATPRFVTAGGGSDVNALVGGGFPAVNLCNDMIDIHTDSERIALSTLERLVDLTVTIVEQARTA
ncbi:MAG: M20/M25/M40 family metallo-hydrolase [Thermoleophilia bacterium]|nr:M20/M25/M40 family metallo-hydrolase [Thermoleophilia bacterium]MDH3724254.1 M20/M25/M40 family metallo-hydrolase [Thermoleophilia bacterium]